MHPKTVLRELDSLHCSFSFLSINFFLYKAPNSSWALVHTSIQYLVAHPSSCSSRGSPQDVPRIISPSITTS